MRHPSASTRRGLVIAIDGPASSGKGTLARGLAARFGLPHLDTGLLYRATGMTMLSAGLPLDDAAAAAGIAAALREGDLADPTLRSPEAGEAGSVVSAIPEVRAALDALQRGFASRPGGAVLDGRDIGTIIAPDADAKVFVTASPGIRAARQVSAIRARGGQAEHADILRGILVRDERDSGRPVAPLAAARDALVLDTTAMDADQALAAATAFVLQRVPASA